MVQQGAATPSEYGVVQRVDHTARTAEVNWYQVYLLGTQPRYSTRVSALLPAACTAAVQEDCTDLCHSYLYENNYLIITRITYLYKNN